MYPSLKNGTYMKGGLKMNDEQIQELLDEQLKEHKKKYDWVGRDI